jgi:hypothetical protein
MARAPRRCGLRIALEQRSGKPIKQLQLLPGTLCSPLACIKRLVRISQSISNADRCHRSHRDISRSRKNNLMTDDRMQILARHKDYRHRRLRERLIPDIKAVDDAPRARCPSSSLSVCAL